MEENNSNNQEGVGFENQGVLSDNNPTDNSQNIDATVSAPAEPKPSEPVAEAPVSQPVPENPAVSASQPLAETKPEIKPAAVELAPAVKETEPEIKAEPLPTVSDTDTKKGGIIGKVIFIVIIILVVFLLVKFFGNNGTSMNVLDTISNVNVKVSNDQEQGKVNVVPEDSRKLNDKVSEEAANQPQLATTSAVGGATASTTKIIAYYPNTIKNPGAADCSKVFALERNAEKKYDSSVINTIKGLLATLTPDEKALGFTTNIPAGTMLKTIKITDKGVAEVNFTSALKKIGGSCAVAAARAQIEQTVKQFPQVKSVLICVEGNCKQDEILQP